MLIEQHVRSGRVDHQGALEFSSLGAVPGEQQLIVAGEHRLAVGCEDGVAVAEQQQWHNLESPLPILGAPQQVTQRDSAFREPAGEGRRLLLVQLDLPEGGELYTAVVPQPLDEIGLPTGRPAPASPG